MSGRSVILNIGMSNASTRCILFSGSLPSKFVTPIIKISDMPKIRLIVIVMLSVVYMFFQK